MRCPRAHLGTTRPHGNLQAAQTLQQPHGDCRQAKCCHRVPEPVQHVRQPGRIKFWQHTVAASPTVPPPNSNPQSNPNRNPT